MLAFRCWPRSRTSWATLPGPRRLPSSAHGSRPAVRDELRGAAPAPSPTPASRVGLAPEQRRAVDIPVRVLSPLLSRSLRGDTAVVFHFAPMRLSTNKQEKKLKNVLSRRNQPLGPVSRRTSAGFQRFSQVWSLRRASPQGLPSLGRLCRVPETAWLPAPARVGRPSRRAARSFRREAVMPRLGGAGGRQVCAPLFSEAAVPEG